MRKFKVGPKSVYGSSAWDLGWSKRSNEEDGTYFVLSCPAAGAVVKQSKTGTWVAYIDFKDGNNRHSIGMEDEFDAMDWAQKIIHNYATSTVASTDICAATYIPSTIDEWVNFFQNNIYPEYPDADDLQDLRDDLEHNRYIGRWVDILYDNGASDEIMDALESQFDDSGDDNDYTYMGKKYRASCDTGAKWESKVSDNPLAVLGFWFKWSAKYPMEAAISTRTRADGVALLEAAKEHLDELYNKYNSPYKYDYLRDAIDKGIANGCRDIIEGDFGDQIHPFSFG